MTLERKKICIDLDGVLATFLEWNGQDEIGDIITGAKESLKKLKDLDCELILNSTRFNPDCVDVNKSERTVLRWLDDNEILLLFDRISHYKPLADAYIDDRGITFYNWTDAMIALGRQGVI